MTNLVAHTRRYKISLWKLAPISLEPISELCELLGFSTTFAMNSIPNATAEPAHGLGISPEGVTSLFFDEDVDQLTKDRTPVGICVTLNDDSGLFAKTSNTNATETDYWPTGDTFVFKGYLTGNILKRTSGGVSTQLEMTHWLSDLTRLQAYNPRTYGNNVREFAQSLLGLPLTNANTVRQWGLIDTLNQSTGSLDALVEFFKSIFQTLLKDSQRIKSSSFGYIDPQLLAPIKSAIQRISAAPDADFASTVKTQLNNLSTLIMQSIGAATADSFMDTTVWNSLVGEYFPMFILGLSPQVNTAYIIPKPSAINKSNIEVTEDEVFELSYQTSEFPLIASVCSASTSTSDTQNTDLNETCRPSFAYPPVSTKAGGPVKVIQLPAWLDNELRLTQYELVSYTPSSEALQKSEQQQRAIDANKLVSSAQAAIGLEFTRSVYLSEVFGNRTASVVLPFRATFCPGACVKISVASNKLNNEPDTVFYGTVESITLNAAQNQYSTSLMLTNIRNQSEYEDSIYNPSVPGMFQEVWSGKDSTLYGNSPTKLDTSVIA